MKEQRLPVVFPGYEGIRRVRALAQEHRRLADLAMVAGITLLGLALIQRLFQPGFPPGVDTPLYLHLSWFTQETLQGSGGVLDPYWYGGFRPYTTYPPVTYTLVGALAAIPGVGLVPVYKVLLLAAYAGTGIATTVLAREMGSGRLWGTFVGALVMLAHPLLVSIGLWGWFASIAAMPFALLAWAGLERAYHRREMRFAVWGGLALGMAVLTHHMTAFAFGLGIPAWGLYYLARYPSNRRHLLRMALWFTVTTTVVTVWWIIPWLVNLLDAGFRRETPGLWTFPLVQYMEAITSTGLIAQYGFPSYIGIAFIIMAVGGTVQALVMPSRYTPYAILLLILVAFSLGEQVNPLLRIRPFDGLDVARFHLFMVPIMAVVGLPFLASLGEGMVGLVRRQTAPWVPGLASGLLAVAILGQMTWDASVASGLLFQPYRVSATMGEALDWFAEEEREGKVLGVGFWHWDDFLLPYRVSRAVVDGWHDEGAKNWRAVRSLRTMMWTREIDVSEAHRLLREVDGRYIVVDNCYPGEAPSQFRQALRERPELFEEVAEFQTSLDECQEQFPRISRSMERFLGRFSPSYPLEEKRMITIFQRIPSEVARLQSYDTS